MVEAGREKEEKCCGLAFLGWWFDTNHIDAKENERCADGKLFYVCDTLNVSGH